MVLLVVTTNLSAQNHIDSTRLYTKVNDKYLVSYWTDTKSVAAAPFHWRARQWSGFAAVVGVGVVTYIFDKEIFDFFQQNRSTTGNNISKYLAEPWGSGLYTLPLLTGIYIGGKKDSRHRNIALNGVKAFILSAGASAVMKHLFHRHRPTDNSPPDPRLWEGPFPLTTEHTAFPSGHTTVAFAVASVLAYGYRDKLWVGISSYTIASLTGLSRIYDGKHWASDVVAGAALGTFIGLTLSKINLKPLNINPTVMRGGFGVNLSLSIY